MVVVLVSIFVHSSFMYTRLYILFLLVLLYCQIGRTTVAYVPIYFLKNRPVPDVVRADQA